MKALDQTQCPLTSLEAQDLSRGLILTPAKARQNNHILYVFKNISIHYAI